MDQFPHFLLIGKDHILDKNGYDHILFVIALCAVYAVRDWRKVLILVTAFTIGHSITLALAAYRVVEFSSALVEFLIPVTIFVTAVSNLFRSEESVARASIHLNYVFAGVFGLIHGLGFSTLLRELLGKSQNIVTQLLAFNIGLEIGQIIIVALFMALSFIIVDLAGVSRRDWKMVISSAIAGIALILIKDSEFLT
ncbi:MAG TPA: HupE/UreJ family protein [Cyclobacteriaceae bacterium]|nr:HupE/UreJ family protein [Cyclobacteriaceae bacterium]